jgi:hypothetical protein
MKFDITVNGETETIDWGADWDEDGDYDAMHLITEQQSKLAEKDKLLEECYEFILNNVGVQDEYIDYEGKSALLKRLKGE